MPLIRLLLKKLASNLRKIVNRSKNANDLNLKEPNKKRPIDKLYLKRPMRNLLMYLSRKKLSKINSLLSLSWLAFNMKSKKLNA